MGRHRGPSCFVPRGQTESFQGGDFKLFVIWCPAVVFWGKHLLLQLLSTCLITAHPITVSVCAFSLKCFQLFKSAEIRAGPNSWLWVVLVKPQKQGVFHSSTSSLEWLGFLYYIRFRKVISWNRSVWKWEKKPFLLMFSNILCSEKKTEVQEGDRVEDVIAQLWRNPELSSGRVEISLWGTWWRT